MGISWHFEPKAFLAGIIYFFRQPDTTVYPDTLNVLSSVYLHLGEPCQFYIYQDLKESWSLHHSSCPQGVLKIL